MRVVVAQIAPRLGEVQANLEHHLEVIEQAREAKADVLVFPELSLTGYELRDQVADCAPDCGPAVRRLAEASTDLDLVVGYVDESPAHKFYNAAAYLSGGEIRHVHHKVYLPTYGMFDEGRYFARGDVLRTFDTSYAPAGMLVCEDVWHPTSAWLMAQQGASILFVPSSGPTRGARPGEVTSVEVWHELLSVTAQFQTAWVVYCNRVGGEDGLIFGGGSIVIDPFGRTVAEIEPLAEGLLVADLDGEVLRRARTAYPLLRDADVEMIYRELGRVRRTRFDLPGEDPEPST
ncbi:hypothetical protein ABI59_08205 [Acidobacteria bacterium Mor1]|nr:hypothetical protein ABI59_08205 [Acidobacteria bacterium Mor1]